MSSICGQMQKTTSSRDWFANRSRNDVVIYSSARQIPVRPQAPCKRATERSPALSESQSRDGTVTNTDQPGTHCPSPQGDRYRAKRIGKRIRKADCELHLGASPLSRRKQTGNDTERRRAVTNSTALCTNCLRGHPRLAPEGREHGDDLLFAAHNAG